VVLGGLECGPEAVLLGVGDAAHGISHKFLLGCGRW
jgi:hypothetical protein